MQKHKIIFLDFDGVIRLGDADGNNQQFSKHACGFVERICEETGAKIVVTSDLRRYAPYDSLDNIIKLVPINEKYYHEEWKTPEINLNHRCDEIWQWLNVYAATLYCGISEIPFAIVDDNPRIFHSIFLESHLHLTSNRHGLEESGVNALINILKHKTMIPDAHVKLFEWGCHRNPSSFSHKLYDLISKADKENRTKIARGFPEEVDAMNRYNNEKGFWENLVMSLS